MKLKSQLSFVPLLALYLVAAPVSAASDQQLLQCSAKSEDSQRLACYDALARMLAGSESAIKHSTNAQWSMVLEELRDEQRTDMRLSVKSQTPLQVDGSDVHAVLTVSCEAGKASVSLNWNMYLGLGSIRMRTHFDGQQNRSNIWLIADDNQTVLLRRSDISFIKTMMRHDKLTTEVTPFGQRPVTVEFNIEGLSEVVKPLRKLCNW